jgi:hypothetical protein
MLAGLWTTNADAVNVRLRDAIRDPSADRRLLTALQRGVGASIYERLPEAYRWWHPYDRVREVLDDGTLASWLPPPLQTPPVLLWREGRAGIMQRDAVDPELLPVGFYPTWGTWEAGGSHRVGSAVTAPFEIAGSDYVMSVAAGGDATMRSVSFVGTGGDAARRIVLDDIPAGRWFDVIVFVEAGEWMIEIECADGESWIAVTGPRRVGPAGTVTRRIRNWLNP